MRWIVASILLFIVPYTYVNLKYRKPNKAFEPYADMKAQANVKRLLDAGYTRATIRAERPHPALPASEILPAGGLAAVIGPAPAGLPAPLDVTLVEAPRLPADYADLVAPAELVSGQGLLLQFTARHTNESEQLGGAEVYVRADGVVIVPLFEPVPSGLRARVKECTVLLTLPPSLLAPGQHQFTLAGGRESLRWNVLVR